jgi:hypothetical protein
MIFRRAHSKWALSMFVAWALVSCAKGGEQPQSKSPDQSSTPNQKAAKSAGEKLTSDSAANKKERGPIIDGEHFTVRKIIDQQQENMPVAVFIAPEHWRDQSRVAWNYGNNSSPVKLETRAENPTNAEAFFAYAAAECFCLRPDGGFYRAGQNVGGLTYTYQPLAPPQAMMVLVRQMRGNNPEFKIIGVKDLPDLPSALNLPSSKNQRGVGLKISYEFKGRPVEEEFYGVYYTVQIPYDGPQGRTWQIDWGLTALHSFRAPFGTLEKRRPVFAAIARSFRPNPAWQERLAAINTYLQEEFNKQLQAGYNQIAAAAQLSRQISANNDAMLASIDKRLQESRAASKVSAKRSSADKFSDYIRGVETDEDPYYGTSQHSYNESYHWTDGYGNYRNSNDPAYNPNQNENGSWQLMPAVQ